MPTNNPQGVNGFDGFGRESAYGAVKRLTQATKAAPLAGDAAPALNAPRRAQRQAVRGRAQQQAAPPPAPASPTEVPYPVALANEWAEIAQTPGVSELVLEYAGRARG